MSSLRLPEHRQRWSRGIDGLWKTDKDQDATQRYEVDFGAELFPGETLTGATWTSESGGVTLTDEGLEGNRSTLLIGQSGVVKGEITTNTGRTIIRRLRFVAVER